MAWLLCIVGILFCIAGVYYFKKNAFEEDKSIRPSIVIIIMGVILIAIGTAKYFKLIN
jgi:H+/Cl- antiporter ClcA